MKSPLYPRLLMVLMLVSVTGCHFFTKVDRETEVKDFINDFAASLNGPDSLILDHFNASQNKDAIMAGIAVLQNKYSRTAWCDARFNEAVITLDNTAVTVSIPIFAYQDSTMQTGVELSNRLILWLERTDNKFLITKFDGQEFYTEFSNFRNSIEAEAMNDELMADRGAYYEKAKELQKKYDSIIWYTNYQGKDYFYAVNGGGWVNYFLDNEASRSTGYKMGLVDGDGVEVVPVSFDLVGTPGMAMNDVVEVKKDDKVGYYQLSDAKMIVPVEYEWIIPVSETSDFVLVKKDSLNGWLDKEYQFHAGFPNEKSRAYVSNFEFLPDDLTIDDTHQSMCEIPLIDHASKGIIIPPSFMTSFGVCKEILHGFTIGESYSGGWLVYIKSKSEFLENVSGKISTLITTFTERYLDGREEFYVKKQVAFMDEKREVLGSGDIYGYGEVVVNRIDSMLLEVKVSPSGEEAQDYMSDDPEEEYNFPSYRYFAIDVDRSVNAVKSNRNYIFSELVKMDSSYLKGDFVRYDEETQGTKHYDFASDKTIKEIRNEILAIYGYTFSDPSLSERFGYNKWYQPKYNSYSEIMERMTPIDKHNLIFLERIVGSLDPSYSASL